jgi:hypothetical protein
MCPDIELAGDGLVVAALTMIRKEAVGVVGLDSEEMLMTRDEGLPKGYQYYYAESRTWCGLSAKTRWILDMAHHVIYRCAATVTWI